MRTKEKKISDEAVIAMIARIWHVGSHPELYPTEALPEVWPIDDLGLDVDYDFDFSAPPPERMASPSVPVTSSPGTKKVTIRIPNKIIDAFKASTKVSGGRYQTKMIRALQKAALDLPR